MRCFFLFKGRKSTPNYPNCQEHVTNPCKLYCEQCDTPICDHCAISEKHQTHNLSNIASIIERKKKTFQKDLKELETSLFPKYQEYADNIPVQKADLINNAKKLTIDLDKQEKDWRRKIDNIIKKQKSELEEMHSKQLAELNKQEEEITHTISEIKHSITDLKDVLKSNDVGNFLPTNLGMKISENCLQNSQFFYHKLTKSSFINNLVHLCHYLLLKKLKAPQ